MEKRTKDNPWKLKTPPQTSEYEMYVDTKDGKEIIVCTVGTTVLPTTNAALADRNEMRRNPETGWSWAARMKNRKLQKAPWNIGRAPPGIRLAAGTGSKRDLEVVLP